MRECKPHGILLVDSRPDCNTGADLMCKVDAVGPTFGALRCGAKEREDATGRPIFGEAQKEEGPDSRRGLP